MKAITREEDQCILDLGPTSAANISQLTELGFKVYTEDLITTSGDTSFQIKMPDGTTDFDVMRFLNESLAYRGPIFDAVLFWDVADYLPEPLVKPVIERVCSLMKPGGNLIAFFHTKDAGPETPYCRYHIAGTDVLELQLVPDRTSLLGYYKLQRIFNNRHIENLFRDYSSLKFFLARDNLREVLVVR